MVTTDLTLSAEDLVARYASRWGIEQVFANGAVITEAGTGERVVAVVYIAAFARDKDDSVSMLIGDPPPVRPILPSRDGYLFLDREKFAASAGDLPASQAQFMADSHVPWGVGSLEGAITDPAGGRGPAGT